MASILNGGQVVLRMQISEIKRLYIYLRSQLTLTGVLPGPLPKHDDERVDTSTDYIAVAELQYVIKGKHVCISPVIQSFDLTAIPASYQAYPASTAVSLLRPHKSRARPSFC